MTANQEITSNSVESGKKRPAWFYILLILTGVIIVCAIPYLVAARDAQRVDYAHYKTQLPLPPGVSITDLPRVSTYALDQADTVEFVIDGNVWAVFLTGLEMPQRGEKCFREASDRTYTLISTRARLLETTPNIDEMGRLQRYVFLDDGTSVQATLVAEGFARASNAPGPYRDQLLALQATAQSEGRGCLWAG